MRIVVQVRELLSSNVSTIVEKASDPAKMLRLLRKEIEESDIALHGEITSLTRAKQRAEANAKKAAGDAKGWSDKAKVAMDHDREDLARSALLAREDAKLAAEREKEAAKTLDAQIADAKDALEKLKAKLEETNAQLRTVAAGNQAKASSSGTAKASASNSDHRLDRISELERRVDFALEDEGGTARTHASVDAEIADMQREASVDAEMEKLRKAAGGKRKKAG